MWTVFWGGGHPYPLYFFVYEVDTTTQPQYEINLCHIYGGTQAEFAQALQPSPDFSPKVGRIGSRNLVKYS